MILEEVPVGLSTASVYPQNIEAAFAYAADLGYDGVEVMVWGDPVSQDVGRVERLSHAYQMPILSIHAPCLVISQRVWGRDPIEKLARSVRAADALGAPTVVVHPPFRWQRNYVAAFDDLDRRAGGEIQPGAAAAHPAVENLRRRQPARRQCGAARTQHPRVRQCALVVRTHVCLLRRRCVPAALRLSGCPR